MAAPPPPTGFETTSLSNVQGVVFRGTILKKSSSVFVGFRERLCVITDNGAFLLFKDATPDAKPKKCINLLGGGFTTEDPPPKHGFCVMTR